MIKTELFFEYIGMFDGLVYGKEFNNLSDLCAMAKTHQIIKSIARQAINYECIAKVYVKRDNKPLYTCLIIPDEGMTEFMFYNSDDELTVIRTIETKKLYNK